LLPDVQAGNLGAVRKIILRETINSFVAKDVDRSDLMWFKIGEEIIFVKRVMNIHFRKRFGEFFSRSRGNFSY
jgi:hypothetical protein